MRGMKRFMENGEMANRITHTQAKDYVRLHLDEIGYTQPVIVGSAANEDFPEVEAIDVMFLIPGSENSQLFTVWIETDGRIYGEW